MLPKDTPYPFDSMPEDDYYGEFRVVSPVVPFVEKDKARDDPNNEKPYDVFDEFSMFPKF